MGTNETDGKYDIHIHRAQHCSKGWKLRFGISDGKTFGRQYPIVTVIVEGGPGDLEEALLKGEEIARGLFETMSEFNGARTRF